MITDLQDYALYTTTYGRIMTALTYYGVVWGALPGPPAAPPLPVNRLSVQILPAHFFAKFCCGWGRGRRPSWLWGPNFASVAQRMGAFLANGVGPPGILLCLGVDGGTRLHTTLMLTLSTWAMPAGHTGSGEQLLLRNNLGAAAAVSLWRHLWLFADQLHAV